MVIPASYGGCDDWGWNPGLLDHIVTDCADAARQQARRAPALRLYPAVMPTEAAAKLAALAACSNDELPDDLDAQVRQALSDTATRCGDRHLSDQRHGQLSLFDSAPKAETSPWSRLVGMLAAEKHLRIDPHPSGIGLVVSGRRRFAEAAADFTDEDSTSSAARKPVLLLHHLKEVECLVRQFGEAVNLSPSLVADLALAGRCHDLGKADPRFQTWLAGGNRLAALRDGLLAKSSELPSNGAALAASRRRSGYPEGGRHELLSVRLLESAGDLLRQANDPDLVRHLIESHHGRCRAFAPVVIDNRPVEVTLQLDDQTVLKAGTATEMERLGSGVSERFWKLVRRYGWWGLSYLETCLRLADHRASEASEVKGELS